MYWHIILTEKCNSQCRYCCNKSLNDFDNKLEKKGKFDFGASHDSAVSCEKLKEFILQDSEPVIIFYGGEPLLKIERIKEIMGCLGDSVKYCMQTNGRLLDTLPTEYMNRFSRIFVSIDGDRERTDYNKGVSTYDLILDNLDYIIENGYEGQIVAQMTIAFPDLFKQVMHITQLDQFDSVHWQLDAGFFKGDFNAEKFKKFVLEYDKSVTRLVNFWVEEMKQERVWKFYPFLGIFETFYYGKTAKLICGSGHTGYTITTNGKITACPIMNNINYFYAGDLDSKIDDLKKFEVGEPCITCTYKRICGGRCLYADKTQLWPTEGQEIICGAVKHLIRNIREKVPEIKDLLEKEVIEEKDFEYKKYFGPEIIP